MFSKTKRSLVYGGIAALCMGSAAQAVFATTIYSDALNENTGSAGTPLAGQTVTSSSAYAGGTAGATWGTNTAVLLESGIARTPYSGSGGSQIYLPFTAEQGYIYTLTMTLNDIRGSTTSKGWASVGFASSNTSANSNFAKVNNATAFVTVRTTGSTVGSGEPVLYPGDNASSPFSNGVSFGTSTDNGQQTVEITLNTTGANTALSPWTAQATLETGSLSSSSVVDLPAGVAISYVGFGNSYDQSSFANFTLAASSQNVPEPGILSIFVAATAGLALLRRRRAI